MLSLMVASFEVGATPGAIPFEPVPPAYVVAILHRTLGVIGTGISLGNGMVLTNHHVLLGESYDQQNGQTRNFLYPSQSLMVISARASRHKINQVFVPSGLKADFANLDYAFLQIEDESLPAATLSISTDAVPLSLVGWSDIVFRTTFSDVARVIAGMLYHCNETLPGYSGGPVINRSGDVVALHKGTLQIRDFNCPKAGQPAARSIPIQKVFETVGTNIPSVVPILKERLGISGAP
jgi:hypothetical protein